MSVGVGSGVGPKLALLAFGVALSLLLSEVGLRAVAMLRPPAARPATDACEGLPDITRAQDLYAPWAHGCYNGVVHRTNGLGLRGARLAAKPDFRILVVGDSVAMGSGVEEAQTYSARLEQSLNEADTARSVEVVNAGVAGFNIERVAQRAERLAPRLAPDLIVYGYTLNDLEGEGYVKTSGTWGELRGSPSALVRFLGPRLFELAELVSSPRGSYVRELADNYRDNRKTAARLRAGLERMRRIGERESACVVVFLHTYLFHLNRWHPMAEFYDRVAQSAQALGLSPVHSLPSVVGRKRDALWVGRVDPHPNAEGHARFAGALEAGLRGLPDSCHAGF
ncbi:MAG: SGNH/GDSL hydrolase family protein [Deltaproteobacteria bacterium]|nr:SGNH/GDSL hydrolase family protein [Deltaproteobacteria bacterium]